MGIGGFLGTVDSWEAFDGKWRKLIADENIPWPFSMKDFVQAQEDFEDTRWRDRGERLRILNLLLAVIEESDVIPVGASVVLADYRGLSLEQQARLKGPYFIAFQDVTYNIAFGASLLALDPRASVAMVYAKAKKFTGPAEKLWYAIKEHNPLACQVMSSYTPAEPKDVSPLQAADIWAYSLGRTGEKGPEKSQEAYSSLHRLMDIAIKKSPGNKFFTLFNREQMLARLGEI